MGKLVGIDIRGSHVRGVSLRTSYRRVQLEALSEIDRAEVESLEQAVQACALPLVQHADAVATAVDGQSAFIHRLKLPATAQKQLGEVLPFELEAEVPVDFDELVYDFYTLPRRSNADPVLVLTASTTTDRAQARIDLIRSATGHETERLGCGPIPLANLASVCPELAAAGPVAIVDLADDRSDIVVLQGGHPAFGRTLSIGVAGLPETAPRLAAALRQSLVSAAAQLDEGVRAVYLSGGGAAAPGAQEYLSAEVGVSVSPLPAFQLEDLTPDQAEMLPRFAKALGLALGLRGRPRDLDLRQGGLSYQRGFAFLKDKAPLLVGLGATVLVSFFFSTWAELRALGQENEVLSSALSTLSQRALGEETTEPDRVFDLLNNKTRGTETDPMPEVDGFDVMVELSKAVPETIVHDVDELDVQRDHVAIRGIVDATSEAQQVADNLKKHPCFGEAKISKVTQVVNSSKQKYTLEFDVTCPSAAGKKRKAKGEED